MNRKFKIGDKVKYSASFLRNIGCYAGAMPFAKGIIKEIKEYGNNLSIASIEWELPTEEVPAKVSTANLVLASDPEHP